MNAKFAVLASLTCTLSVASDAQEKGAAVRQKTVEYQVRGFVGTDEMEPWDAELRIQETDISGKPALRATYDSRRDGNRFLYSYSATWMREGTANTVMHWSNRGSAISECRLTQSGTRVSGTLDGASISASLADSRVAMPDFAVPAYLSQRVLNVGDTIPLSVVYCGEQFPSSIQVRDVRMVVRGDVAARGSNAPEPVWLVETLGDYRLRAWIAKSDHVVLRSETPQGSVGYSMDTFVRLRP